MKKNKFILTLLIISSFLIVTILPLTASAKAVKTPSSLRGTWYNYDSNSQTYSKLKITKYHFHISSSGNSISLSGVKYPKYAQGHAELSIYRSKKGNYTIGSYASDEWPSWKRLTHKRHLALRQLSYTLPGPIYYSSFWYKTKAIAKHPSAH